MAGKRAVIEAAVAYHNTFDGGITAGGKLKPANVVVIGGGVAGLAAAGTAKAMGASVKYVNNILFTFIMENGQLFVMFLLVRITLL